MKERRRATRYPVSIKLTICDLYRQDYSGIHGLDTPIEVENISQNGLCFVTEGVLPVGYYFNATISRINPASQSTAASQDSPIFTTVKILHSRPVDHNHYRYGCEFAVPTENIGIFL